MKKRTKKEIGSVLFIFICFSVFIAILGFIKINENIAYQKEGYTVILNQTTVAETTTISKSNQQDIIPQSTTTITKENFIAATTISSRNEIIVDGTFGADGNNIKWALYDNGELVITGKGSMGTPEHDRDLPWLTFAGNIIHVTVEDQVSDIAEMSFKDYQNLVTVRIGGAVKKIGFRAFQNCEKLLSVEIAEGVEIIDFSCFYNCENLLTVKLPNSLITVGSGVFQDCENLETITIGNNIETVDYNSNGSPFWCCSNIKNIYYTGTPQEWDSFVRTHGLKEFLSAKIQFNYIDNKNTTEEQA